MDEYVLEVLESNRYEVTISERVLRSILAQVDRTLESVTSFGELDGLVMAALDKGDTHPNKGFYTWRWLQGGRGKPDEITIQVGPDSARPAIATLFNVTDPGTFNHEYLFTRLVEMN